MKSFWMYMLIDLFLLYWNCGFYIWDCIWCKIVKGLNIDVDGCRKKIKKEKILER